MGAGRGGGLQVYRHARLFEPLFPFPLGAEIGHDGGDGGKFGDGIKGDDVEFRIVRQQVRFFRIPD